MLDDRHVSFRTIRLAAAGLSILFASPGFGLLPGALVGDCDEDARVTVGEVVTCVSIALGRARLDTCPGADANDDGSVGVDELVGAVGDSLGNPNATRSPTPPSGTPTATPTTPGNPSGLSGSCSRPGKNGLIPCSGGTVVAAFRCEDPATCTSGPSGRTLVGSGAVDGSGSFSVDVAKGNENEVLVLEVDVGQTPYRALEFGSVGPGGASAPRGAAGTISIDPISEASVRILDDTTLPPDSSETVAGLSLFRLEELDRVAAEVRLANANTAFGGTSDGGAVEIARETADTPQFQIDVIRESLNTFIRTDRGCQETGQLPVYGSDDPVLVTYRVDDFFGGKPASQAAVRITFLSGVTLLEEDISTGETMEGELRIVGPFALDATLLLTAEADGVQVTSGCRMRYDGSLPVATPTATRTQTTMPTATPTATGSVGPIAGRHCSDTLASPLPIPDDDVDGASNSFVVSADATIEDLDVEVAIEHPFAGDLVVALAHDDTETNIVLVDRPGEQTCSGSDVACVFDDDAARLAALTCSVHVPALGGGLVPDGLLGAFQGESLAGTWRLSISDEAPQDVGRLVSWCLRANSTAPVVTSIACNDEADCFVAPGEAFALAFSFRDRDGDASAFRITARDSSGTSYEVDAGAITPARGEGTLGREFPDGFACAPEPCEDVEFFVVVSDEAGQTSPFASVSVAFTPSSRSHARKPAPVLLSESTADPK
jgi:subtilisin-like proprotein convertase family protein